jgi:hypothetical protein
VRAAAATLLLLGGCATTPDCPPGLGPATIVEAFFGRNAQGAEIVSEADWARFAEEVVTPAFPDGLTVLDGAGQWRRSDGRIIRERSKILLVALPRGSAAQAQARLAPVIAAYRARFGQDSVMVATRQGCVGF